MARKIKGRYRILQEVYNEKGLLSEEFYRQIVNYIKYLLAKYLVTYGYTEDQMNDCYAEIIDRVTKYYDPEKGALGHFIHSVVHNYANKFKYHAKPKLLKEPKSKEVYTIEIIPLDFEVDNIEDNEPRENLNEEDVKAVLTDLKRLKIDEASISNLYGDVLQKGYEHNAWYRMVLWKIMSK